MSSKPSPAANRLSAWAALILGAIAVAPYRVQFHSGLNDEAIVIQASRRMLDGQLPYRDFDLLYTPGSMMLTSLWMRIGDESIEWARWLMVLVGALIIYTIFLLAQRTLPERWAALPAALFAISGYSEWPVLSYHWFATLGLLLCLDQWLCWQQQRQRKALVLSGVACGGAALCLQSEGVACVLAVTCLVLLEPHRWREKLQQWLLFVVGILTIWMPFLALLTLTGLLWPFIDNTIIQVLGGLLHSHAAPYSLEKFVFTPWKHLYASWPLAFGTAQLLWLWETLTTVLVWSLKYALLFPVMLLAAWQFRQQAMQRGVIVFLFCWTFMLRERLDLLYSNYLMPLWYLSLVYLVLDLWRQRRTLGRCVCTTLIALYLSAGVVAVKYINSFRYPVVTPGGILWSQSFQTATTQTQLYRRVAELTPPGSLTFAWPYATSFYVLSATKNPTRSDFLVSGWQRKEQAQKVVNSLEGVDTVYFFPLDPALLADYPNVDPATFQQQNHYFMSLITSEFVSTETLGPVQIFQRSSSKELPP